MERSTELTPKQQTSEAIRQAETILITTGQHPSADQVASTIALAQILRKFGKKVTAIVSDKLPDGVTFLPIAEIDKNLSGLRDFIVRVDLTRAEVDKLKYTIEGSKLNIHVTPFKGGFAPSDVSYGYGPYQFDLVIVLGVSSSSRIDRVYQEHAGVLSDVPIINIDFHRSNEHYGAVNLVEPYASSLAEILVALAESLQTGIIDETIATSLLTGIMASTDRFTATHTSAKSLTVAAQMMAAGAKQQEVVKGLFKPVKSNHAEPARKKPVHSEQSKNQLKEALRRATTPAETQPKIDPEPIRKQTDEVSSDSKTDASADQEPTQTYSASLNTSPSY